MMREFLSTNGTGFFKDMIDMAKKENRTEVVDLLEIGEENLIYFGEAFDVLTEIATKERMPIAKMVAIAQGAKKFTKLIESLAEGTDKQNYEFFSALYANISELMGVKNAMLISVPGKEEVNESKSNDDA